LAERVARGARPQERQHQIGAASQAPDAEGLAEVLVVPGQAHRSRHVEETEQAEGGVEDQSTGVHAGVMELGLQQVVAQVDDIAEVGEDVVHALLEKVRGDLLVTLGQRLQGVGVDRVVETEYRAVEGLPRVFFRSLGHRRQQRHTDTGEQPSRSVDPVGAELTHRNLSLDKYWLAASNSRPRSIKRAAALGSITEHRNTAPAVMPRS